MFSKSIPETSLTRSRLLDYLALTKPRVAVLVLFTVGAGALLASPEALPLAVTPSTPSDTALVPELFPTRAGLLAELVTVVLPAIAMLVPLCLMIESFTLALPPFEENAGMKPDLQVDPPPEHWISFAWSAGC